uniref:Uncharacterized protein n=1 Tax=Arundo donax TaxID=35708 RepID=A0A0A9CS12_ARUDO
MRALFPNPCSYQIHRHSPTKQIQSSQKLVRPPIAQWQVCTQYIRLCPHPGCAQRRGAHCGNPRGRRAQPTAAL